MPIGIFASEHALVEVNDDTEIVRQADHPHHKRALQADLKAPEVRQLKAQVTASEQTVAGFDHTRRSVLRNIRTGELSKAARVQALSAPLGQLMQTLRTLAYCAETAVAVVLAPQLDSTETERSLLQTQFRSDASLLPDGDAHDDPAPAAPSQSRTRHGHGPAAAGIEPNPDSVSRHATSPRLRTTTYDLSAADRPSGAIL